MSFSLTKHNKLDRNVVICDEILSRLKCSKNLLAFSHGTDSTALFWLLLDAGVEFDLAMVNYGVRAQSNDEITSAKSLASQYGKEIFVLNASVEALNFEANARAVRYKFFAEICNKNGYENVILAHQLDDMFEWFLMQLGRGAGLSELLGMNKVESRAEFTLVRPLLDVPKAQILHFLNERGLKFFIDESNKDERFLRNFIRANFSEPFLELFASGVARSFEYLQIDKMRLKPKIKQLGEKFYAVKNDANVMRGIDKVAKILGTVLSKSQKDEATRCLQNSGECVLSGKIALGAWQDEILLSPYMLDLKHNLASNSQQSLSNDNTKSTKMDKNFREKCRILGLPKHIRAYLYEIKFDLNKLVITKTIT